MDSKSSENAKRRASRLVKPEPWAPGPLRDLKEAVWKLYLDAQPMNLDEIRDDVADLADGLDLPSIPGRDRIRSVIAGSAVPASPHDTVAVAVVLARAAARIDLHVIAEQIKVLWQRAAGQATAPAGAVTESPAGYAVGGLPPSVNPAWWMRSGYLEQVRDIAPGGGESGALHDRDGEIAALAMFCTGEEPYLWWRADPWAGKSALMSTFVLHPPAGVDVVSFFVTARLSSQADSSAFTDALLDQLGAIVGESIPMLTSVTARDAHRRALLRATVDKVAAAGRRLVLVVDGLDEDRGGVAGSGLASIASLLPKWSHPALRVIVASRPDRELPKDVPADHPLRRCHIRELDVSPYASELARRATAELAELLSSGNGPPDVLGLITACGGGLTLPDLEELTEQPPYRLLQILDGVFGRTVGRRRKLYVFAHETLRETAVEQLGSALLGYRDRLHHWAERYRGLSWPAHTPHYLPRDYPRMLQATGDVQRLISLATDASRHDRMLDLIGGDAAAIEEITAVQSLLLAEPEPDIATMALLSVRRSVLADRNANTPSDIPAVWARLGQPARAEALARSITYASSRTLALVLLAIAVAESGDADRAEQIALLISDPESQLVAVAAVSRAVAVTGDHRRAERIARSITHPYQQAVAFAMLAKRAGTAGDLDGGRRLAADAERCARSVTDPYAQVAALASVIREGPTGDIAQTRRLAADAERLAWSIPDPHAQAPALSALAKALVAAGDLDRGRRLAADAEQAAGAITDPYAQAQTLTAVVEALAAAGDHLRAKQIAQSITSLGSRADALTALAEALTATDDLAGAEAVAQSSANDDRTHVMIKLIQGMAAAGHRGRAEQHARSFTDPVDQAKALIALAKGVVTAGYADQGRQLAVEAGHVVQSITEPLRQPNMLTMLASIAVTVGDLDQGRLWAVEAEQLARSITEPYRRTEALAALAEALAVAGDHARAAFFIQPITDPAERRTASAAADPTYARAQVLARPITDEFGPVARAAADDLDHARLWDVAEEDARLITDPAEKVRALAALVEELVTAEDLDRARWLAAEAEQAAASITQPRDHDAVRAALAGVSALCGDLERAEQIVRSMRLPQRQFRAWVALTRVADPAQAYRILARVFASSDWWTPLSAVALLKPEVVTLVADAVAHWSVLVGTDRGAPGPYPR